MLTSTLVSYSEVKVEVVGVCITKPTLKKPLHTDSGGTGAPFLISGGFL